VKNTLNFFIGVLLIIIFSVDSYSQTEGFNVKTPIQKIADSTSSFMKEMIEYSVDKPQQSINKKLLCSAKCFVVIPEIELVISRGDFTGTGLMSCRTPNSNTFTEPLFYQINNLETFEEDSGGLLILVNDKDGVKAILGNDVHFGTDNISSGLVGDTKSEDTKSFASYVKYQDQDLSGIDLSGSVLVYSSKDTFNAYQGTVVPVNAFISPEDVPPVLRDFGAALEQWTKNCKQ